ncbi:hypothetical protein GEO21_22755, partial [Sphingobacterium faecium]|uniref:hypothetical protein n=1 Tax=Sphingobacterium faecium TaxID=34087 RepID=UPI0012918F82
MEKVDLLTIYDTIDATDFIFIFNIDFFSHLTENYLNHFSRYIIKNFNTQVFIIQNDVLSRINEAIFLNTINFRTFQNASQRNSFINSLECDFVCIIESHYILTKEQIYKSIELIRSQNLDFLRPYDKIKIFSEQSFYNFQFDLLLSKVENKLFELYNEKKFDKSVYFFKKKHYNNFVELTRENIPLRPGIKDLLEIKLVVLQMKFCILNEFISIYKPEISYENNKNQITFSKYLNTSNFDKKRLLRDLEFSKKKKIKASINDPKIALAILTENKNQRSLPITVDSFRTMKLEYQEIYENSTTISFLKNALISAIKHKVEYLILCDQNIKFVAKNINVEIMNQIQIMKNHHLYIGYCGVRGHKLTVQRYFDNILVGENIAQCPLFIICKNVFREILININDDRQSIIEVFAYISTKKFIV